MIGRKEKVVHGRNIKYEAGRRMEGGWQEQNKNIIDVLALHTIHNHIWLKYLLK